MEGCARMPLEVDGWELKFSFTSQFDPSLPTRLAIGRSRKLSNVVIVSAWSTVGSDIRRFDGNRCALLAAAHFVPKYMNKQ